MNGETEVTYGCWVRAGSYGKGTCERLPEGGCAQCPDYQAQGLGLYDREPPEGYAQEWTRILAGEKLREDENAVSYMVFRAGGEWLALRTARFEEITPVRSVHAVPSLKNPAFLGLVNISGELLPCLFLPEVLGMAKSSLPEEPVKAKGRPATARMAVVDGPGGRFVFPVDEMAGAHRLTEGERRPAPATVSRAPSHLCGGVFAHGEALVGILEEEPFFLALLRSITG